MNKYKQKLISFAAAAAMIVSALPVQVGAYENHATAQVNHLPHRTAYYTLAGDSSANWSVSNEENTNVSLHDDVLVFTNNSSNDRYGLVRNITDAPASPNGGLVEIEFDVKFSNISNDRTRLEILGESKEATESESDNFILSIRIDQDGTIRLLDANSGENIQISSLPGNANGNLYNYDTIRVHSRLDFNSRTYDIDIYTIDNGTPAFKTSYTECTMNDKSATTASCINLRAEEGSTIELSNLTFYRQGSEVETPAPDVTATPDVAPTDEPAEPSPTTGVPITDGNTLVYDLDTDERADQGWVTNVNESSGIPQIPDVGDGGSATYDNSTEMLTLSNTEGGYRSQLVTFNPSSTTLPVQIDSVLTMTADGNGLINTGAGFYNVLSFKDNSDNILFTLRYGNDGAGDAHPSLYINDEHTGISAADDSESITFELRAVVDPEFDTSKKRKNRKQAQKISILCGFF